MTEQPNNNRLGKYEVIRKLGEGGFGVVYECQDTLLERRVALKVLRGEAAASPEFIERFRREARLAAALRHPAIVNMLDMGEDSGRFYLVMDLLPGGTLAELLKDGQPLLPQRAIQLLRPVAAALDFAHSRNMLHRDVKPSNIILNELGEPVLTDFGLGKIIGQEGATTTGVAVGTVQYMAPEQVLGEELSPATDIYALGVIAYQMLTGRVPFAGATPFSIQKGHVEQKPPDPRLANPALGEASARVLEKVLDKQPADRYQSGAQLVAALEQASELEGQATLEALYQQASALQAQGDFTAALQKWTSLQNAHPGYRDVAEKMQLAGRKLEIAQRYARLAQDLQGLRIEARAILALDSQYPDPDGALGLLVGARQAPPAVPAAVRPDGSHPQAHETAQADPPVELDADNPAGIEWVKIPAGSFISGESRETREMGYSFEIAKYPVTNAQYKRFLDDVPGVEVPSGWDENLRTYPPDKANHPVVWVSLYNADAFCRWAGGRLPNMYEWEKAARGKDGRKYPWGSKWQDGKFCNTEEAGLETTNPVDAYPLGASPYGVMDMSGNTWEWTSSSSGYILGKKFALRGGSWANDREAASINNILYEPPDTPDDDTGFRCARDV